MYYLVLHRKIVKTFLLRYVIPTNQVLTRELPVMLQIIFNFFHSEALASTYMLSNNSYVLYGINIIPGATGSFNRTTFINWSFWFLSMYLCWLSDWLYKLLDKKAPCNCSWKKCWFEWCLNGSVFCSLYLVKRKTK
jgi:hypothetical protein